MGKTVRYSKNAGLHRGAWTVAEDMILTDYITIHGEGGWTSVPQKAGLKRCGKSCRLRWLNYLRSDIKLGNISPDEKELIIKLHQLLGNRWSLIAGRLPGRTDNEIKNYWNTHLSGKPLPNKLGSCSTPKTQKFNARSKSPSQTEDPHVLKVIPVKPKAVKVSKELHKSTNNGRSDHQDFAFPSEASPSKSWCELFVDELMVDNDLEFLDFTPTDNFIKLESPSMEVNGEYLPISTPNFIDQQDLFS
ncbi:hypothetical protein KI387_030778 [Taxus chinensis]|uniref:Uncharacterized protein n=1 Tax=Taxus chinensis TaxID=29808 RepID=A0AA38FFD3_TAXCH|nr:hypothetical protein KI387_030778 [Taxus chinensis]